MLSIILQAAACFCIFESHSEKKLGHHSETKSQSPPGIEYKKYCLNSGESYFLVDEIFVGSICMEEKAKRTFDGTRLEFHIRKGEKILYKVLRGGKLFLSLTVSKSFISKSDTYENF